MQVNVVKANLGDAGEMAKISSEVSKEGSVREFSAGELEQLLSSDHYYIAVAKVGGEVVGYAMSSYSWGKLHIRDVAVKPDRRRIGVGKALIKHLLDHASEKGLPEAYCEVKARNIPALNLFAGLGFKFRLFSPIIEGGFFGLYHPLTPLPGSPPR